MNEARPLGGLRSPSEGEVFVHEACILGGVRHGLPRLFDMSRDYKECKRNASNTGWSNELDLSIAVADEAGNACVVPQDERFASVRTSGPPS